MNENVHTGKDSLRIAIKNTCIEYSKLSGMTIEGKGRYLTLANLLSSSDEESIKAAYDMAHTYQVRCGADPQSENRYEDLVMLIGRIT